MKITFFSVRSPHPCHCSVPMSHCTVETANIHITSSIDVTDSDEILPISRPEWSLTTLKISAAGALPFQRKSIVTETTIDQQKNTTSDVKIAIFTSEVVFFCWSIVVSVTIDFLWNGKAPAAEIFSVVRDHSGLLMGRISSESVTSIEDCRSSLPCTGSYTARWFIAVDRGEGTQPQKL